MQAAGSHGAARARAGIALRSRQTSATRFADSGRKNLAGKHEVDARLGRPDDDGRWNDGRRQKSGMKDGDMMKHHDMMEKRMDMMQTMIEQMMQRDQEMGSMPAK